MNTIQLLQQGLNEHHAGRLEAAAGFYSAALEVEPGNVSALRCLGVLRSQQGDFDGALHLLQAAARFAPEVPEIFNDLGNALRQKGALDEALLAFNESIRLQPVFGEAYFNRGLTYEALGRMDLAGDSYDLAIQADPMRLEARFNRAAILMRAGDSLQALPDLIEILRHQPGFLNAGLLLGRAYREVGRWKEAERRYRRLGELNPNVAEIFVHLGTCQLAQQKFDAAAESCSRASTLDPENAEAHYKAGVAWVHCWQFESALAHLHRAAALQPDSADIALQLAIASRRTGRFADADAAFHRALTLAPENSDYHWHYADFLLLLGDYHRGWDEFEYRWHTERFLTRRWSFHQPLWTGEDIRGKTILLHPEQGFGDTLQFVRYVPMVAARGARVLLGTPPELARLLAGFPETQGVYVSPSLLPPFDVHCPLMSLPRIFRTTVDNVPSRVPYLNINPSAARHWRAALAPYDGTLKVGIVWSGNPNQENNRHRACRLADFAPLLGMEGVTLFSLQKGPATSELHTAPPGSRVIDLSQDLGDFAETAAALGELDLFISTDTGPAHLAGALARPVWLLVSAVPDWRWMIGRADSPWYPTMRLFRQSRIGEWTAVFEQVTRALAERVAGQRRPETTQGAS